MNKVILATIIGTSLFSISALSNTSKPEIFINVNYNCDKEKSFNALYINDIENSYAVIGFDNRIIPMKIIEMASGASYKSEQEKDALVLNTKGDKADLVKQNGDIIFSNCTSTPAD